MIKCAIIGVSGYGAAIYHLCKARVDAGEMVMSAAVIRTPSKVPDTVAELEEMGCRIFADADRMFDEMKGKLDLVCIPTGIETHAPLTIAALEAGAHVMVEKPAAGTLAEVDAMIEAEKRSGKTVSVGFQDIYRDDIREIKERLLSGEWGQVESVSIHGRWPRERAYYARNNWAGCIRCGDALVYDSPANNALAHYMNLGLFLAGNALEESAQIQTIEADLFRAYPIESFDTIVTRATSQSGVQFHYTVTHATTSNRNPVVRITTDQACLVLEQDAGWLEDLQRNRIGELPFTGTEQGRSNILPAVLKAIGREEVLRCSLTIARAHTAFINQLHGEQEIRDFPAEVIEVIQTEESEQLAVRGLPELMEQATAQCALFRELDVPWATPACT